MEKVSPEKLCGDLWRAIDARKKYSSYGVNFSNVQKVLDAAQGLVQQVEVLLAAAKDMENTQ